MELLAAERTFLAWVRTSIALISLGFVVAKFSIWLHELSARLNAQTPVHHTDLSLPIGMAMMAFGGAIVVLAAWHFHCVNRAIEQGEIVPNRVLVLAITAGVALLAALMVAYMLLTAETF